MANFLYQLLRSRLSNPTAIGRKDLPDQARKHFWTVHPEPTPSQ